MKVTVTVEYVIKLVIQFPNDIILLTKNDYAPSLFRKLYSELILFPSFFDFPHQTNNSLFSHVLPKM